MTNEELNNENQKLKIENEKLKIEIVLLEEKLFKIGQYCSNNNLL